MGWFKSFWKKLTGPTAPGAATFLDETIVNFTPRAQQALVLARKETDRLHHHFVGTEHILLGLLREGDGVAARVLKQFKVDLEQTRKEILKELDPNFMPGDSKPET
jgi:ATP-dependent Clp protease ATP-binding subunit ClpC